MLKLKGNIHEKITFRLILMIFMLSIIGIMTLLLILVLNSINHFNLQLDEDLNRIVALQTKSDDMENMTSAVSKYTLSGDEAYELTVIMRKNELKAFFERKLQEQTEKNGYYLYYDLSNMFQSYLEQADRLTDLYDSGAETLYINAAIFELRKVNTFIKEQLSSIISYELNAVNIRYGDVEKAADKREELVYLVVAIVIIITFIIGFMITNVLAKPIHQLSVALNAIGNGDYNKEPIKVIGMGEMAGIIKEFNQMKQRLSENIELIHENSMYKEQLKNQEINLLEKENHLKQSKLDFLQSQINPHFLYNTLNSIQTLADIEEAPQTEKMLQHLGSLMRYNVKKNSQVVLLQEEVDVISSYVYIQMIRFGNRIQYETDCDAKALQIQVPSMILQPLVENAMIHGLEPKLGIGLLKVSAKVLEEGVLLTVKDNGLGMSEDTIASLMAYGEGQEEEISDKNIKSIGMANVIRRCRLFYGKNIIKIHSQLGEGTEIEFLIPSPPLL